MLGKGEQSARIPLNVEAVDVLARFLNCAARDLGDVIRSNPHRALVPASRGAPRGVAVSQIYESVCRVAIAASENAASIGLDANESAMIGATRPHGLRAYRATHLFNAGTDARHVQRFFRHADLNTTLLYDHTRADRFHDAII